ncbi:MAG: hypothetical protein HW384_612 [Dehalococcoidia bacterium]|nr:hypothetical protein [Dehalococcoidia bacterium]
MDKMERTPKMASNNDATQNLKEQGHEQQLTAILTEYKMLREEMRLFGSFHRRDSQILIGVMAVIVSLYLSNQTIININVLTLIIPSLVFIYLIMQISTVYVTGLEAKACARIEKRINKLLGNQILMDWETTIGRTNLRSSLSPTPFTVGGFYALFVFIFIFFSFQAFQNYGTFSLVIHGVELVILALALVYWVIFETNGILPP